MMGGVRRSGLIVEDDHELLCVHRLIPDAPPALGYKEGLARSYHRFAILLDRHHLAFYDDHEFVDRPFHPAAEIRFGFPNPDDQAPRPVINPTVPNRRS